MEEHRTFELMRCLTLVEAGLAPSAQGRARIPFDHEQRALNPAEFPQRLCQLAFHRRRRELFEDGRGDDGPRRDRGCQMEQIVPMIENQRGVNRDPDVVRQRRVGIALLECVEFWWRRLNLT